MRKLAQLGLLIALLPLTALAQAPLHSIDTVPAAPRPGEAFQLRISGDWPNACPLEVESVVVKGVDIDVFIRASSGFCAEVITPYTLIVDLAQAGGSAFPAASDYRVRYSFRDGAGLSRLLAFRLVDVQPADARRAQPEAGFWQGDENGEFPPPQGGMGFMVERQGAALAITTNAYQFGGQPIWYLAAGGYSGSVFRTELLRSFGGQPLFGFHRVPQGVETTGRLDVEFGNDASAIFWYSQASGEGLLDELNLMPVSARKMNFALGVDGVALAGNWVLTGENSASRVTPETMSLSISETQSSASEVVLEDLAGGHELRCTLDAARPDAPPRRCTLSTGRAVRAQFDNNTLNRLSGLADADSAYLVRVNGN